MNRNDHYVPDGLFLEGSVQLTEIAMIYPRGDPDEDDPEYGQKGYRKLDDGRWVRSGRVALGKPDAFNRDTRDWWWADVSGNGSHWAHFNGHRIQVDIRFSTVNRREVNEWKGRDEIRAEGGWMLSLNRQPIYEGLIGSDPLAALRRIPGIIERLIEHDALDWYGPLPVKDQLLGRRVYYERTPAVISSTCLEQGAVILKPVGVDQFPVPVWAMDDPESDPGYDERDELKDDLLSPRIWWWRDE